MTARERPWWLLTFPVLVVIGYPPLALYIGGIGSGVAILALAAAMKRRTTERDTARTEVDRLERELTVAETERDIATDLVDQWRRDIRVVRPLSAVAPVIHLQRTGAHDHLAEDDAWFDRLYDDKGELR